MKTRWSRREFLKTTAVAVVLGTGEKALAAAGSSLPKRPLGKTGEMVSCMALAQARASVPSKAKTRRRRCSRRLFTRASITSIPPGRILGAASNG